MNRSYFTYIKQQSARYLFTHLVISIYSYLILVCWGLPFTPLSFLGNLIFNPILVLFLGISTIIFFCSLCCIPIKPFVILLEWLTYGWLYALHIGATHNLNITCPKPPFLVIAIVGLATFVIIAQRSTLLIKNLLLILLIGAGLWSMKQQRSAPAFQEISCGRGNLSLIVNHNELTAIDPGYLGQYSSAPDFVEYTLLPYLTKHYGTTQIDHLILLQPGQILFEAIHKLVEKATVKHIYMPLWQGQSPKRMLYHFMRMKEMAQAKGSRLHRLAEKSLTLYCHEPIIELNALATKLTYSTISFNAFVVTGSIDKKMFTLYPAKYTGEN